MTESLFTISVIGLVAGFIFSMPIAGPVSILITSNALKGRLKYCNLLATGASLCDFIYVLVGVYGITHFFTAHKGLIPYILGAGSFFILYIGIRIIRTKFDQEHIDEESSITEKKDKKHHNAFYTGFMINLLNPTLFFGWLVSSFIILSFAASLGFNTSGLNSSINKDINQIENIEGTIGERHQIPSYMQFDTLHILKKEHRKAIEEPVSLPANYHLLVSLLYSAFLALGSILWFMLLAIILVKFRKKINTNFLNWIIRSLGIIMCLFALFFAYTSVKMLL